MPLKIVRADVTKIVCDAIVNPTNEELYPGGGVDALIHSVAGKKLYEACSKIGGLEVGGAKVTPAYDLPCKLVIHTAGPYWEGGDKNEEQLLKSCYRSSLEIARGAKCESVAFPLISSGTYGYPKEQVLRVATEVIKEFLEYSEMLVYLVVFDKTAYAISKELMEGVSAYVDDNYVLAHQDLFEREGDRALYEEFCRDSRTLNRRERKFQCASIGPRLNDELWGDLAESDIIKDMYDKGFKDILLDYVDAKGLSDVECYKRANVSRQTWHKIINDESYRPNKKTILSFAIALRLNMDETQRLLSTMGFTLSKYSLFDVIIMYCIARGIYDVIEIDTILFKYDQETLFSKE